VTPALDGLILDLDGVVADTEPLSLAAVADTYAAVGVRLDEDELRRLVGIEFRRLEPLLRARYEVSADPVELRRDYDRRYRARLLAGIEPTPGVVDLVEIARSSGVRVGIASASPLDQVLLTLDAAGLRQRIDVVAAGSEVERTKPAPDVYVLALDRLAVDAGAAVAIEDSAPGIAAARAAGLACIGLRTPTTADHDLSGAALVVSSLEQLRLADLAALIA
jgi:HAD superfamily hydrolase (TIGR01509 family)